MSEVYEASSDLTALPVEELFTEERDEKYLNPYDLMVELCIEHGRMEALHDYIKAVNERNFLDVKAVKAIIGYEEDEDE